MLQSVEQVGCACGSGAPYRGCCGAPLPSRSAGQLVGERFQLRGAPLARQEQALLDAVARVEHVLQQPSGDVGAALAGLSRQIQRGDLFDTNLLELACQLLLHGHGDELLALAYLVVPRPGQLPEPVVEGQSLRLHAFELLLLRLALLDDGAQRVTQTARFVVVPPVEVTRRLESHHRLRPGALDRQRYRFDRSGVQVVPLIDELLHRFTFLLVTHWGWPAGRAVLARQEIERVLMMRFDEGDQFDGLHACRDCGLLAPARRDLARGATALALDVNNIILAWPRLMGAVGGPFRGAALLEALPSWVGFLESLRLIEPKASRVAQTMLARSSRLLAPTLTETVRDRALAASVARLMRAIPAAS